MKAPREPIRKRLRIIRGQVDGILQMVEDDRYCIDISTQLMAVIAALKAVNRDVLTAHLKSCVLESLSGKEDAADKVDEVIRVVEKLSR